MVPSSHAALRAGHSHITERSFDERRSQEGKASNRDRASRDGQAAPGGPRTARLRPPPVAPLRYVGAHGARRRIRGRAVHGRAGTTDATRIRWLELSPTLSPYARLGIRYYDGERQIIFRIIRELGEPEGYAEAIGPTSAMREVGETILDLCNFLDSMAYGAVAPE
jgi:hypothetical protein